MFLPSSASPRKRTRRSQIPITAFGKSMLASRWVDDRRCVVSSKTLLDRIASGWEPERALSEPKNPVGAGAKQVTAFGESRSIAAWTRDPRCKAGESTVRSRLKDGWPLEKALSEPSDSQAPRSSTAFGKTMTPAAWTLDPRCTVLADILAVRISAGWDPEDAITRKQTRSRYKGKMLQAFGERKNIADWGTDPRCAVPRPTLRSRLAAGWPLEKALTQLAKPRIRRATSNRTHTGNDT